MSAAPVAVIDIGSNTIKLLVAARDAAGHLQQVASHTLDASISAGIGGAAPRLGDEGLARGVAAVTELVALARAHHPVALQLVATSAVRDATNGGDFQARVHAATGCTVRILSGDEEANLIGRGLTTDPALAALRDFHVFDLGGGSLECLRFANRQLTTGFSLPLGCVRLTERFIASPAAPFDAASEAHLREHVRAALRARNFSGEGAPAVFAGGSMTTVRAITGAITDLGMEATPPYITTGQLENLLSRLRPLDLAARQIIPGLPPTRADVFPAAVATMLEIAALGGFEGFHHSLRNLRWGLAAELLGAT